MYGLATEQSCSPNSHEEITAMTTTTFDITISDEQRLALIRILTAANLPENSETMIDQTFLGCLIDLPQTEKAEPGILHGLCY
jgi:hypothetical protein